MSNDTDQKELENEFYQAVPAGPHEGLKQRPEPGSRLGGVEMTGGDTDHDTAPLTLDEVVEIIVAVVLGLAVILWGDHL